MATTDDLPAAVAARRARHGVLAVPAAAALELAALAGAALPRPRVRVGLPRAAWTAASLYIPRLPAAAARTSCR